MSDTAGPSGMSPRPTPPWQHPEPSPSARYSIVGDSLRVETGEGVTEVVYYDIPTLIGEDAAVRRVLAEADRLVDTHTADFLGPLTRAVRDYRAIQPEGDQS